MRLHRKIWLWWNNWIAVQFYWHASLSLGVHVDFTRPYVDFHFMWATLSIGRNPVMTNLKDRYRGACRGFLFQDGPVL
jgi:hypothetical protein